jgi:nitrogen fixation protein NifU and related proteins
MAMDGEALSAQLGPLPPMRIHCAQLVEGALRQALSGAPAPKATTPAPANAPTLMDSFSPTQSNATKPVRVILKPKTE